jgi:aldehyde:ferredoxin oxidoreductase
MINDSATALRVHLTTQAQHRRSLPASWNALFGGGRGIAAKLISELPPDLGPLDPENPLIIVPGMLHGSGATGAAGSFISARSPLTRALAHGWSEGDLGNALSRAGIALLLVVGAAAEWSILLLSPDGAEIVAAPELCGLDTVATTARLQASYGPGAHVLALGPAGEAGVAYAAPVVDGRYLVEPAGVGVVMAAKRLKAIVVRGGRSPAVYDASAMQRLGQALAQRCETLPLAGEIRRFGSAAYINLLNDHGAVTGRNGQDRVFKGMLALSRATLGLRGKQQPHGACPLHCQADFIQRDGSPLPRPDLEALLGFGVRCGVADLETVLLAHDRCVRLGIDVTAAAAAIAFLMECQQQGLHRTPALPWGDGGVVLDLIEKIGRKEGVGGVLSLGVGEMQSIFYGSESWAPQAHGGALSPIDPRTLPVMALHLATSAWSGDYRMALPLSGLLPNAPDHLPAFERATDGDPEVSRLIWHERFAAALDAFGICRRWGLLAYAISPVELADLASLATGVEWTPAKLAKLGERIVTLERLAVLPQRSDERLPRRWQEAAPGDGRAASAEPQLERLLARYYAAHGWDSAGQPSEARLRALDIVGQSST